MQSINTDEWIHGWSEDAHTFEIKRKVASAPIPVEQPVMNTAAADGGANLYIMNGAPANNHDSQLCMYMCWLYRLLSTNFSSKVAATAAMMNANTSTSHPPMKVIKMAKMTANDTDDTIFMMYRCAYHTSYYNVILIATNAQLTSHNNE